MTTYKILFSDLVKGKEDAGIIDFHPLEIIKSAISVVNRDEQKAKYMELVSYVKNSHMTDKLKAFVRMYLKAYISRDIDLDHISHTDLIKSIFSLILHCPQREVVIIAEKAPSPVLVPQVREISYPVRQLKDGRLSARYYYDTYGESSYGDRCKTRTDDPTLHCLQVRTNGSPFWAKKTGVSHPECKDWSDNCKFRF